ncbi:MAG: thiol-disulfide oxidoreductase DCC family protein [Geminicoccaceae bacterium]
MGADPTVLYNGACPICRTEIEHYKKLSAKQSAALDWIDVSVDDEPLRRHGLTRDTVFKRLHVDMPDGRLVAGVDAFIEIWSRLKRYRWLAALTGRAWIKPVADLIYDRVLAPALFAWHKRRERLGRVSYGKAGAPSR